MQASKISVMICLGAMSVMPFVARADDTPEQARLREILHAAEAGHPYQPETPGAAADASAARIVAPADAAAPMKANTPMEQPVAEAVATVTNAPAEPAVVTPPTEPAMTPAPVVETPTVPASPVVETPAAPAAPAMEVPAPPAAPVAETPAAPAAPAMEMPATPAVPAEPGAPIVVVTPPAAPDVAAPAAPTVPDMSSMQTNMANAETQALKQAQKPAPIPQRTLTADQQQRLAALTAQYKADQLSPEQYHEQRAKIIAEP